MNERDVIRFVGVTGLPGAGKGEFAVSVQRALKAAGLDALHFSLSEALRDYVRQRNLPVERPVLREVANELREAHGPGILAQLVIQSIAAKLPMFDADARAVIMIDGIRNPKEVEALRQHYGEKFLLVALDAPEDVLVERIVTRQRADEAANVLASEEAIRRLLAQEAGHGEPEHGHSIAACMAMADWYIDNVGSLEDLVAKTQDFVMRKVL